MHAYVKSLDPLPVGCSYKLMTILDSSSCLESFTAWKSILSSENVQKSLHYTCGGPECFTRKFFFLAMHFELLLDAFLLQAADT